MSNPEHSFEHVAPETKGVQPELVERSDQNKETETINPIEALIVLGSGFDKPPRLSLESHMRARAAAELIKQGAVSKVILSGGHTAGMDQPSEAQGMFDLIKRYLGREGTVEPEFILEEQSIDTGQNAAKVQELLERMNIEHAIILTSASHVQRARQLFTNYGVSAEGISAEEQLRSVSERHGRFIDRYLGSWRQHQAQATEAVLRGLMIVDRKGQLVGQIAKKIRK